MEQSKRIAEYRALKQVIEDSKFELPKRLVESSTNEYVERELRRLAAERTPVAEVEGRMEEIRNESAEAALRDIKIFTAINEIGEAEGIQVTDEDFEKEAENLRARTGMEMQVVQRFLAQSEQRNEYESRIFRQKAVAVVMEHATVTDKEVGQDALNKAAEEAAEE
jgi:trigger factor